MPVAAQQSGRPTVDGKFFRIGAGKFHLKGVTYGPFPPDSDGDLFAGPDQSAHDFSRIRELGANVIRVYTVPPRWLLDLATEHELYVVVDVPWRQRECFLDTAERREAARAAVRDAARHCADHRAVFALSVANEIPSDIVRWSGPAAVADFIDELVGVVKSVDPDRLCTFGNFPPSEYLRPRELDFVTFNVYLHQPKALGNYLARLQMLADTKPLVLGEVGMDSRREGEAQQADFIDWTIDAAFRGGAAGICVYSYTDEWFKDGRLIDDWKFGLTRADRGPKPAFGAVRKAFAEVARPLPSPQPLVSVVVAAFDASRTLAACLDSLQRLNYPAYEVILVDDGSTDETPRIAAAFPTVRLVRHATNLGLSVARNTGITHSRGEIIAFTDADCRADEDWLRFAVADLTAGRFSGIGGHNLLPADDSLVAAAVMISPGGPAHVMLTDRVAEHIPGCNMLFWRWALEEIGGFDPAFRLAGDDVDVCWRLQQRGGRLGFSPAGFVWHYRRSSVRDYLRQQHGYGEAEALLERKHPEYFNRLGGSMWRGRIYSSASLGLLTRRPMIYHGLFGDGLFQSVYLASPSFALMLLTSLEYHALIVLPLIVLATVVRWLTPVLIAAVAAPVIICTLAAFQATLPRRRRRWWSRPLVGLLYFLQPLVRGLARYQGRLLQPQTRMDRFETLDSLSREQRGEVSRELGYTAPAGLERTGFLAFLQRHLDADGWRHRVDTGWHDFDLEVYGSRWAKIQIATVREDSHVLRARLRPVWTLPARLSFWFLLGAELLLLGLLEHRPWGLWLSFAALPLGLAWWFRTQQDTLRRVLTAFIDRISLEAGLVKLPDSRSIPTRRDRKDDVATLARPAREGPDPAP
ncbi:MAG: glycosyltransferase family 2 protein [Limisphaerales bacterium]